MAEANAVFGLSTGSSAFIAIIVLATVFGAVFRAYSGFGAGLFLVPTFSLFLPPAQAIVVITLLNMPTTFQLLPGIVQDAPWRRVLPVSAASALAVPVGVYFLTILDADMLRRGIGGLVIAFALLLMSGWRYRGPKGFAQDASVGAVSGMISGATGMGGPPIVLYFLSDEAGTIAARAAFVASFSAMQLVTLISFAYAGLIDPAHLWWFVGLLPIYVLATWAGAWLHHRTRHMEGVFRTVALSALLVIGALAIMN